jgi:hypothetical protein
MQDGATYKLKLKLFFFVLRLLRKEINEILQLLHMVYCQLQRLLVVLGWQPCSIDTADFIIKSLQLYRVENVWLFILLPWLLELFLILRFSLS